MIFTKLDEEEYLDFWKENELKTFLSSPQIAKYREQNGWSYEYVGVKNNNKVIAAALLLSRKRFLNKKEYYAIRGPLLDYSDEKISKYFFNELTKYIKKNKGYILRIDPYILTEKKDIDGNCVAKIDYTQKAVDNLKKCGFKKRSEKECEQDTLVFVLDIKDKKEDEVLLSFKPNTRNLIYKVNKSAIELKELKPGEFDTFYNVLCVTGEKKGFNVKPIKYYEEMYKLFNASKEIKFLVAELDLKKQIRLHEEEIAAIETNLKVNSTKYNKKRKENLLIDIENIKKRINVCKDIIKNDKKEKIILSASMFMMVKPEIVYLYSGNIPEYMSFNGQYKIQWEMIQYAIKNKYSKYNFYGIDKDLDPNSKDYGIYKFKRGFNGNIEELIGEYILITSGCYYIINTINKFKSILRRNK